MKIYLIIFILFQSILLTSDEILPQKETEYGGMTIKEWGSIDEKDKIYPVIVESTHFLDYADLGYSLKEYPLSLDDEYEVIAAIRCEGRVRRSSVWTNPDFIIWGRNNNYEYLQIITPVGDGGVLQPFMEFMKEDRLGVLHFHNYFSWKALADAMSEFGGGSSSIAPLYNQQVTDNAIKIDSVNLGVMVKNKVSITATQHIRFKPKSCSMMDKDKTQRDLKFWTAFLEKKWTPLDGLEQMKKF